MEPYQNYLDALRFERERATRHYQPFLGRNIWRDIGVILAVFTGTVGGYILACMSISVLVRLLTNT